MKNFEVSFNSPQCGFMSIGFSNGESEFRSTTACEPHTDALPQILSVLTSLLSTELERESFAIGWSRNPEAFDLYFNRAGEVVEFKLVSYPSESRDETEMETVFQHSGPVSEFCRAFAVTFEQLYEDRETDEFEANWRQPFPVAAFENFRKALATGSN